MSYINFKKYVKHLIKSYVNHPVIKSYNTKSKKKVKKIGLAISTTNHEYFAPVFYISEDKDWVTLFSYPINERTVCSSVIIRKDDIISVSLYNGEFDEIDDNQENCETFYR